MMVLVCLPSDALAQHLPSYLGFSYLGRGLSLHGCSSKAQPLLLTLDEGYLLMAATPDLECGVAPLGLPAPAQPLLLGSGVAPLGRCPWPRVWGKLVCAAPMLLQPGALGCYPWPLPNEDTVRSWWFVSQKKDLTRSNQLCWHPDLGLPDSRAMRNLCWI